MEPSKVTPIPSATSNSNDDIWNESIGNTNIKDFEEKVLDSTYARSPLKPLTNFLNLGVLVGVFPAQSSERKIRFHFGFSVQLIWALIFTVLWLGLGVGVATYTCMYNDTSSLSSAFYVKTTDASLILTATDQLIVLATPWILVFAWILFLILSWSRINKYSDLCYNFCQRGFRIGNEAEYWTLTQFGTNYLIFLVGQAVVNVHLALVYCPTVEKQILFAILITIWMLPPYTAIVFTRYIFMQFCRTLSENFKQLRFDIGERSKQVSLFLTASKLAHSGSTFTKYCVIHSEIVQFYQFNQFNHNVVMDTNLFDRMYFWRENSYSYNFNLEQIVLAPRRGPSSLKVIFSLVLFM